MLLFASSAANASFTYTAKRKCKLLIMPLIASSSAYINIAGVQYYACAGGTTLPQPIPIPIYMASGQSITISNPGANIAGCIVSVLEE